MARDAVPEVFLNVDSSVLSDALDRHGLDGVITGLPPVHPDHRTAGRALPMQFERAETDGSTNFPFAMLEQFTPGCVFVLANPEPALSCWGGLASKLAGDAGLNGVVIDGGYRDVSAIRAGSFPVFGRQPTPRSSQGRMRVDSIGESVEIAGVAVADGDIVVADSTGVVVVPSGEVDAVAESVEAITAEEQRIEAAIDAGVSVQALKEDDRSF